MGEGVEKIVLYKEHTKNHLSVVRRKTVNGAKAAVNSRKQDPGKSVDKSHFLSST